MKKRLFSLFLALVMIAGVLPGFALTAGAAEAAYVRAPLEEQLIRQGTSGVLVPDVFCDPELSLTIEYDVTYTCGDTVLDGNVAFNNWIAEQPAGTYEIGYALDIDETQYTVHGSLTGTFRVTVVEVLFFVGEEPASAENAFVVHADKLVSGNSLADMVTLANGLTARYGGYTDANPENFILIADGVDPEQIPAGEFTVRLLYQGEMDGILFSCIAFETTITVAAAPEAAWGTDADNLPRIGTLAEAINAEAAYIQLVSRISQNKPLIIPHSTTLDLNGQFLSVQAGMGEGNAVTASGDLTIIDSSTAGNGVLEAMVQDSDAIAVNVSGSISVEGGALIALGKKYGVSASVITISGSETTMLSDADQALSTVPNIGSALGIFDESGNGINNPVWTGDNALKYVRITKSAASVTTAGGETTAYRRVYNAILAAQQSPGSTLKLLNNVTSDNPNDGLISSGSFTIDLNGQTWTLTDDVLLHIRENADITITDSSSDGTGKLLGAAENQMTVRLTETARLEIAGGTIENSVISLVVYMDDYGSTTNARLTVSGGTLKTNGSQAIGAWGDMVGITGGTFESSIADIYYRSGKIDLSTPKENFDPAGITILNGVSDGLTVSDDTIRLPEGYVLLDGEGKAVTTLVMGKTYTVGMPAPVASVTVGGVTTDYTDLVEAITAAKASEGSTLKLLEDITTAASSPVKISSGSFTLDLNGKTWTFAGEGLHIRETADIILIDSSSDGTGKLLGNEQFSTVYLYGTAKLEIQSGTLEGNSFSLVDMAVFGDAASELTVSGGTLLANGSDSTAITARGALVKVTGGTIVSSSRDISYLRGKIDLSEHNDSVGITINNNTGADVTVSDDTIKLPADCVMLKAGEIVTSLEHGETYTVGMSPDTAEAAWGTDADYLSGYGMLADAVKAVETGAFRYVRLLKDVTLQLDETVTFDLPEAETEGDPLIFDFNGHTITGRQSNEDFAVFDIGYNFAQGVILRDTSDNPGGITAEAGRPFYTGNIAVVEGGVYTGSKPASVQSSADPAGQIPEIKGGTFRTTGEYSFEAMGDEVIISGGTFCHGTKGAITLHSNPLVPNPVLKLSGKIDIVDETPDTVSADLCIQGIVGEIEAVLDLSAWKGGSLDVMLPTIPEFPAEWQPSIDVDNIILPDAKWCVVDGAGTEVTGTMKDGILYTVKVRDHNVVFYDNSESNWEYVMAAFRMDDIMHYDQGTQIGESSLYFFEIPEGVTDIYFTNHMPGMPPEVAPEVVQRTASFTVVPNETYDFVPGSAGGDAVESEVKWGTSATSLPNSGTWNEFVDAVSAYNWEDGAPAVTYAKLGKNIETDYTLYPGKTLIFDLAGYNITAPDAIINCQPGCDLTIIDSAETDGTVTSLHSNVISAIGKVEIDGGRFVSEADSFVIRVGDPQEEADVIISGGEVEGAVIGIDLINGKLTVNNGVIRSDALSAVAVSSGCTLIINGGSISSEQAPAVNNYGSTTITGDAVISGKDVDIAYLNYSPVAPCFLDLSGWNNADGTKIQCAQDTTVSDSTIKLPAGLSMLDVNGDEADDLAEGETYTVGVAPATHSVYVSAVDASNGVEIPGATMQLLEGQSKVIAEWESGWEPHTIEGLKAGVTYTLRAIAAPRGYILPTDTTFSINTDGTLDKSSVTTTDENGILLLEFVMTMGTFSAVDAADGKAIAGAHLQILDSDGNAVDEWISAEDDAETVDVDESVHETSGLKTGVAYTLHAAAAPGGYTISDDTAFSINEQGQITSTGSVTEEGVILSIFEMTEVRISAVDIADGEGIEGATLQILDAEGNLVEEWVSDTETHEVTGLNTNEEYTLRVTGAPDGYTIPSDTAFVIDEEGRISADSTVTEDGVLLVEFVVAKPAITSLTFNSDSEAYDAATNTFYYDADHPLVLKLTGENLTGQTIQFIFINSDNQSVYFSEAANHDTTIERTLPSSWLDAVLATFAEAGFEADIATIQVLIPDMVETQTYLDLNVAPRTYTVTFVDYDGKTIGEPQTVARGKAAAAPDAPTREGWKFTGWDTDYSNVTDDLTVTAQYEEKQTIEIDLTEQVYTYDGTPKPFVIKGDVTDGFTVEYATSDGNAPVNGGERYGVCITRPEDDTYKAFRADSSLVINPKPLTDSDITVTVTERSYVYDGEEKMPTVTVKHGDTVLTEESGGDTLGDFYISGVIGGKKAGVKGMSAFGRNNYTDFVRVFWEILPTFEAEAPAKPGEDGKIVLTASLHSVASLEYAVSEDFTGAQDFDSSGTQAVTPGTYYVRIKALPDEENPDGSITLGYPASSAVKVVVPATYAIIFDTDGGSEVAPIYAAAGSAVTEPEAPTKAGYSFVGWDKEFPTVMPAENITLTARWTVTEYGVDITQPEGGKVETDKENPVKGDEVTVTVTPDEGKEIVEILVRDENGTEIPVIPNADGTFSYIQPAGDVTVEVIFRDAAPEFDYELWHQALMLLYNQTFSIRASASEGGSITPEGISKVKYDRSITYTVTPEEGYEIVSVLVDGKDVGAVSEYTFTRVRKAHTIEAVFAKTEWENPFTDVAENNRFYEDIRYVCENGLMNGVSLDRFSPDGTLTRAMLVTILWRLAGEPVVNYLLQFEDVPQEEWYTEAVRWAAAEGIVLGYGDGRFGTEDPITREQLAVILYRYEQKLGGGFTGMWMFPLRYTDAAEVSEWAYEAVCWMTMKQIYVTREDGMLTPAENAFRAETAAFLRRYCEYRETQE